MDEVSYIRNAHGGYSLCHRSGFHPFPCGMEECGLHPFLPAARLELARANPADFESAVSTNSTMPACLGMIAEENIAGKGNLEYISVLAVSCQYA